MGLVRPNDQSRLEALFWAAIEAVDAKGCTARFFRDRGFQISSGEFQKIWILGGGKATAAMATAAEDFLLRNHPEFYAGGIVVVKEGHGLPLKRIQCREASHPVPDKRGEEGATELLRQASTTGPGDLIVFLVSGGASALLPLPEDGISLTAKMAMTRILLECGADIHEINALRKHTSRIKGGRLVLAAPRAHWVTLAVSDVPGDSPESIGSGPTVGDSTTLEDCWSILKKYGIETEIPPEIVEHLKREDSETPKPGQDLFSGTQYHIVARNKDAVDAARDRAERLMYKVVQDQTFLSHDLTQVVQFWKDLKERCDRDMEKPYVAVCGGEPTLEVKGSGKGGRNTELALRLAGSLPGKFSFVSAGTDGTDGPTDAAGAFSDETTVARAADLGMDRNDYLRRNDSYSFFEKIGDLLVTGPTGTNVMDLQMLMVTD